MPDNSFYIGWSPKMPASLSRFLALYILILFVVVSAFSIILPLAQKPFSKANFEYGKPTTVEGTYLSSPVPHLVTSDGNEEVAILLVGYGKHGANGVMDYVEKQRGEQIDGKKIKLKGTLIYGDGKTLMQVDINENPLISVSRAATAFQTTTIPLSEVELKGEIVDPKCFFGVMKPGEGKVHKECAIRCISGGIPPVLKLTSPDGSRDYVIITQKGQDINKLVLDHIATPVVIKGTLTRLHNWFALDVQSITEID